VLPGGRTPFVLRGDTDQHGVAVSRLVGDCYLEGVMDGERAGLVGLTCPLQHSVLPTMFWIYCKYDLAEYFNNSIKPDKYSKLRGNDPMWAEEMWANRPLLLCIDKEGIFDEWLNGVQQWASNSGVGLPTYLQERDSDLCTAFRNIERMPRPAEHIVVA